MAGITLFLSMYVPDFAALPALVGNCGAASFEIRVGNAPESFKRRHDILKQCHAVHFDGIGKAIQQLDRGGIFRACVGVPIPSTMMNVISGTLTTDGVVFGWYSSLYSFLPSSLRVIFHAHIGVAAFQFVEHPVQPFSARFLALSPRNPADVIVLLVWRSGAIAFP